MEEKATMNALCEASSFVTNEEVINYVVVGLDTSYRIFLTYQHFHPTSSFDELHICLMQEEDLIQHTQTSDANLVAFVTSRDTRLDIPV